MKSQLLAFLQTFEHEPVTLYSSQSKNELIADMTEIFKQTEGWSFRINLAGSISKTGSFEVSPKYQLLYTRGSTEMAATMYGQVEENAEGCVVKAKLKSKLMFAIGFCVFPLFGLGILLLPGGVYMWEVWFTAVICLVGVPLFFRTLSFSYKESLLSDFKEVFSLREAENL